ncbi:MAG: SCP2 sterol-binding domain-containing protein [Burkholderiales bacterium]|nr:SCP2 sterol-binding domain-containing protein [Burkholderiales bacterium]
MSAGHRPDRPARAPAARRFRFPGIVSDVGARLPAWPLNFAFARALSLAAPRLMSDDDLAALDGVRFRIRVLDTGMSVSMRVRARRFEPIGANDAVDVTFAADALDYARLAARRADPDTLFFERRLRLDGDVEAGLRLRNLLDAIELPSWFTRTRPRSA